MPMPSAVRTTRRSVENVECDALVVGAYQGSDRLRLSADVLTDALAESLGVFSALTDFKAEVGDVRVMPAPDRLRAKAAVVVGLGREESLGPFEARAAASAAGRTIPGARVVGCALHVGLPEDTAHAAMEGFLWGLYRPPDHKSIRGRKRSRTVVFPGVQAQALARARAYADAVGLARDLSNEPASQMTPEAFAQASEQVSTGKGLDCVVLDQQQLSERGFGGVLAVGKGSRRPPCLIQLRYSPADPRGRVVLVGKGVTFDAGGINLKTDPQELVRMKTDMAGGAAVVGAMSVLPRLAPSLEVIGLVPAVENLPGGGAYLPGDIITHYGGRTTEVSDTDSEGRLILADALVLASELGPDAIVDVATLTDAIVRALGPQATGLLANNDVLSQELADAARSIGERLWRMPLYKEYAADLSSDLADGRNQPVGGAGGAIKAALFLHSFVREGIPWAHLDNAGTAGTAHPSAFGGATGAPTSTLLAWIEQRAAGR